MRSTIDGGGRVVIPKPIRDRLGLASGTVVEVTEREGHVEIAPAHASIELVEVDGVLVATSTDELPALTDDIVRETLERTRR
jgi:AbrB family looped-hinge helix DNA binding protein